MRFKRGRQYVYKYSKNVYTYLGKDESMYYFEYPGGKWIVSAAAMVLMEFRPYID